MEYGAAQAPHLARTAARIEACEWRDATLRFDARLPVWSESVPEGFWFSALIRHPGRKLAGLKGARLIRGRDGAASIVSFQAGAVEASFSGDGAVPRLDVDADLAAHLAGESVVMIEPYLAGLAQEAVPLAQVNRAALGKFGVAVWNHFFLEPLPAGFPAAALRDWVTAGGGLVLLTNALRALPQLLGRDLGAMRTHFVNHRAFRQQSDSGIAPLAAGHPVFEGLATEGGGISLLPPQSFDIFQRVDWKTDLPALARLWIKPAAGVAPQEEIFAPAPVLWEIPLGRGRILAYACGLRYNLGSPDRWTPAPAAVRFLQNAVRSAGGGRVAILRGA